MRKPLLQLGTLIMPVVAALIVTVLFLLLVRILDSSIDATPIEVADAFYKGAFRNSRKIAGVMEFWIPLTLVSMGLAVSFRAGLWNIGVEGQMVMGGLFAAGAAYALEGTESALIIIPGSIVAAMIGGALWAGVAGILKVRFGVHEIFSGVALNFISAQITLQLIADAWKPAGVDKAQYSRSFADISLWPGYSREFNVSILALAITVIAVIAILFLTYYTRWGLQLKAVGRNPRSSLLLGVPVNYTAIGSIMLCGALAGIAGTHRVLFTYENVRSQFSGGIGFLGLLVVLLIGTRSVFIPFVAFLFAVIKSGSSQLQFINVDSSLTGVIQSTLVLCVLLSNGVRDRLNLNRADQSIIPDQQFEPAMASEEVAING